MRMPSKAARTVKSGKKNFRSEGTGSAVFMTDESYHKKKTSRIKLGEFFARHEAALLFITALVPLAAFGFMTFLHRHDALSFDQAKRRAALEEKMPALLQDFSGWDAMSWPDKEEAIALGILYFRQDLNTAILKSPGHYVRLMEEFLKWDPESRQRGLLSVLEALAISQFDFYNGGNADEQAQRLLGPEIFEASKIAKLAEEQRFTTGDSGW